MANHPGSSAQGTKAANSVSALLAQIRDFAMPYGIPQCEQVFLRQVGEMRMGRDKPWLPFTAEQTFSAGALDFRWKARSRMFRCIPTTIVDAFEAEHGSLSIHLLGIMPIARIRGVAVDKGEVMRALAELPWRPFRFREDADLNWTVTEPGRLRASYNTAELRASVTFDVDSHGRVLRASAPDRPRVSDKSVVETPWSGLFDEWRFFDQIRVPTRAEVNWRPPEGSFTYWRGRITEFRLLTA